MWLETIDREEQLIPEGILIFESTGCSFHDFFKQLLHMKSFSDAVVSIFLSAQ